MFILIHTCIWNLPAHQECILVTFTKCSRSWATCEGFGQSSGKRRATWPDRDLTSCSNHGRWVLHWGYIWYRLVQELGSQASHRHGINILSASLTSIPIEVALNQRPNILPPSSTCAVVKPALETGGAEDISFHTQHWTSLQTVTLKSAHNPSSHQRCPTIGGRRRKKTPGSATKTIASPPGTSVGCRGGWEARGQGQQRICNMKSPFSSRSVDGLAESLFGLTWPAFPIKFGPTTQGTPKEKNSSLYCK
jgi:hypothetical protein